MATSGRGDDPVALEHDRGVSFEPTARARRLRQAATRSERIFWDHVRDRRADGLKLRRQVPIDGLVVDFACKTARLVVEIDGGVHRGLAERDEARDARLAALGWDVMRLDADFVEREPALAVALVVDRVRNGAWIEPED